MRPSTSRATLANSGRYIFLHAYSFNSLFIRATWVGQEGIEISTSSGVFVSRQRCRNRQRFARAERRTENTPTPQRIIVRKSPKPENRLVFGQLRPFLFRYLFSLSTGERCVVRRQRFPVCPPDLKILSAPLGMVRF